MNAQLQPTSFTGTYSLEDNKLRLYSVDRLDDDLYKQVKSAGYSWAPKQEIFYAHWSPTAEDMLLSLCGDIGDESLSLEDRAIQRAERFEGYQENRAKDAEQAITEAETLYSETGGVITSSDNWRQQRKAEKQKEQHERAIQRAENMWNTSQYWEYRVRGTLAHAASRNNERTLLNRIKKLTAESRKYQRYIDKSTKIIELWTTSKHWKDKSGAITHSKALTICNIYDHTSKCFTLEEYPRDENKSQYEGSQSLWSALKDGIITADQAMEISLRVNKRTIAHYSRWLEHTGLRLNYEKAILAASGYVEPVKPKQPPMINHDGPLTVKKLYGNGETEILPVYRMTKAEYKAIYSKGCLTSACGGYRQKTAPVTIGDEPGYMAKRHAIFLTDSKEHSKPEAL